MAQIHNTSSTDILFPEDSPSQSVHEDSFYSAPSTASYSTYSGEVKYIFDPQYARSDYSDISTTYDVGRLNHEDSQEAQDSVSDIYTPPRLRPHPARVYRNYSDSYGATKESIASRRKTWSPPTCNRMMGSASSSFNSQSNAMRTFHSNEQLDVDNGNFYEELHSPPKLPPVSGMLNNRNAHQSLIKPIAFKPVFNPRPRYVSTPQRPSPVRQTPTRQTPPRQTPTRQTPPRQTPTRQQHSLPPSRSTSYATPCHQNMTMRSANHSQDSGYISQDCQSGSHSHSNSNLSQGSMPLDTSSTMYASVDSHRSYDERPESFASSNVSNNSRLSSTQQEGYIQTPSPSDSGVGLTELEAMLREKDTQIQQLRETMEKNETAIVQVYEERRQNFHMELREVHAEWEQRLKFQQQKAFKTEQALLLQLFRLQQERKNLRLDVEQLRTEKERLEKKYAEIDEEIRESKTKLEEVQWDLCQKSGEISLLKSQLKDSKEETTNKSNDLISARTQLKDAQQDCAVQTQENNKLQTELEQTRGDLSRVQEELEKTRRELAESRLAQSPASRKSSSPSSSPVQKPRENSPDVDTGKLRKELEAQSLQIKREREQWLEEKNKVIRYQKHLQLNYVQMYRKNKSLEAEVEQLTLELENVNLRPAGAAEERALGQDRQESMC